mmetsp:Transcript_26181/g.47822  ORF Transcript_26181/g.47822 Transcript_26181/m.47822 type:complete len:154 (-) Transcript_26181:239-700(-)
MRMRMGDVKRLAALAAAATCAAAAALAAVPAVAALPLGNGDTALGTPAPAAKAGLVAELTAFVGEGAGAAELWTERSSAADGRQQLAGTGAADVTTDTPAGRPLSAKPPANNGPGTFTLAQPVSAPARLTIVVPTLTGVMALLVGAVEPPAAC